MPLHNIPIDRNIDASLLQWPANVDRNNQILNIDSDASEDERIFDDDGSEEDDRDENDYSEIMMGWVNRDCIDLRGIEWEDVKYAIEYEKELLERIDVHSAEVDYNDAVQEDEIDYYSTVLYGLDVGVASTVLALSATGCFTLASCNGSRDHLEEYPVVIFRCQPDWVHFLIDAAEKAGCGLENADIGAVALFADDVYKMLNFAEELMCRNNQNS